MLKKFPEYYEILLDELINKEVKDRKRLARDLDSFRATLSHSMGKGVEYTKERALYYTIYYWPANFFKFLNILEILDEKSDLFKREKLSVADVGCGTGGFFTALVYFINKKKLNIKLDYCAIDISEFNLRTFKSMFFNRDFRQFINFPLKFSTINKDFLEIKKFKKKDLVITSNVFSELEYGKDLFFDRLSKFVKSESGSYMVFIDPVSRKKNKELNYFYYDFITDNKDFDELAPVPVINMNKECVCSDFFDTVDFEPPKVWEELGIAKSDADYIYRIITNSDIDDRKQNLKFPDFNEQIGENIKFRAFLMTKDIYRKPNPPYRFKISDGNTDINYVDVLVNSVEYRELMNFSNVGDLFEFEGVVNKDRSKKRKSRFIFEASIVKKVG